MSEEDFKIPDKIRKHLEKMDSDDQKKRIRYQEYIKSKRQLPMLEKAEAWLLYNLRNIEFWGDYEAFVYFLSRNIAIQENDINDMILHWKNSEQNSFYQCATGNIKELVDLENEFEGKNNEEDENIDFSDAKEILKHSTWKLPNFWFGTKYQNYSIDATMLRTYEWSKIGGFDEWFKRLANDDKELVFHGGFKNVPGCYWLFNMCRSDYAINLNRKTFETALEALKISEILGKSPWYVYQDRGEIPNRRLAELVYPIIAASIIFCSYRLYSHSQMPDKDTVKEAQNLLLKHQDENGGWRIFEDDNDLSVEATSICIHALAISRPVGWNYAVSKGKEWLESKQEKDGYWLDKMITDPVYLTVLALDSIELAIGGNRSTFKINLPSLQPPVEGDKRFKIALSFPGEIRNRVENIANIIATKIGREKVFYDNFYKAQLARLDLDVFLQNIYHNESEIIVVFIGDKYEEKSWCKLEWRAIRDLITKRKNEIMPLKYEETDLSGFFSLDGYIDINEHSDDEIAEFIIERSNNNWA